MSCVRLYLYYDTDWPYKIIPMFRIMGGEFPNKFRHLIVDSGVDKFFRHMRLKDYPEGYLEKYPYIAENLTKRFGERVWITLPDYPADYPENPIEDNMEKTIKNIETMIDRRVNWIVVIQARWGDLSEFERACRIYRDLIGEYPRIAIGTLCTKGKLEYAVGCCRLARRYFPTSWIHVFGPNIRWLRHISRYVNSFDSVAYWKPPHGYKGMIKENVRRRFLEIWLDRVDFYLGDWKHQEKLTELLAGGRLS